MLTWLFQCTASFSSVGSSTDAMSVFNPKMLDASIRDVVASLSGNDKTNVLLYAMEHLPMKAECVFPCLGALSRTR